MKLWIFAGWLTLTLFNASNAKDYPLVEASIQILDPRAQEVLPASLSVELLADNLGWAEGPVWVNALDGLLFSDIQANKVLLWRDGQGTSDYLHPSGHAPDGVNGPWRGANGLALDLDGTLLLAQQGGRTFARMDADVRHPVERFRLLASHYHGKRLNSPNDLVVHKTGSVFFTDPPYGLPQFEHDPGIELPWFGVFRFAPPKDLMPVITSLIKPNGIALSRDHNTLYVTDSEPSVSKIMAFSLNGQGQVSNPSLLFDASPYEQDGPGSTDGLKMHANGTLFITMPNGIGILSQEGELLARIQLGQVCNLAFHPSMSSVFLTAPHRLMRIKLTPTP